MGWALIGIYIFCTIQTFSELTENDNEAKDRTKKRKIYHNVQQKQQKQVKQVIGQKLFFQSYHFQLDPQKSMIEFYLDSQVNDQIKSHVRVLWKHKNAYILPSALKSERVEVRIYENQNQLQTQKFYTKGAFNLNILEDKIYKVVISHKDNAKVSKLITLNFEHYFQSFKSIDEESSSKLSNNKRKKIISKNRIKHQEYEEDSSWQESSSQDHNNEPFELSEVKERVQLLLNETKLLINEVETKHLAEYTIEKYIEDSIQVYWIYQIVECMFVIICVGMQVMLVQKLFRQNKINTLI